MLADGDLIENIEYSLAGTPCEKVAQQSVCFYPNRVQQRFPQDRLLVEMEVESYLGTPLIASNGEIVGLLAALDDRPMEDRPEISSIMEVFATRAAVELDRSRAEQEIADRLKFETLISELSASFINITTNQIDDAIDRSLKAISEFFDLDRCSISHYAMDTNQLIPYRVYTKGELATAPMPLKKAFPWIIGKLENGEVVCVSNSDDDLPDEAEQDKQNCEKMGMQSFLLVPVMLTGRVIGGLFVADHRSRREWTDNQVHRLQFIGEIFANAIARQRAEEEREKAEQALRRSEEQLAHVARISTMGEMVSGIAHELNQPLYAIQNYSKACSHLLGYDGNVDRDQVRDWVDEIAATAEHAGEVLVRLRNFVLKSPAERTPVDLCETIETAIALVQHEARQRGVVIDCAPMAKTPTVFADDVQIVQVLVNLLRNAFEAMQQQSNGEPQITITAESNDDFIEVTVADNGPGIPSTRAERIFDAFNSTKPDGMGLGLAISMTIVESHGGRLWTTNSSNGGAVFRFSLPTGEGS